MKNKNELDNLQILITNCHYPENNSILHFVLNIHAGRCLCIVIIYNVQMSPWLISLGVLSL